MSKLMVMVMMFRWTMRCEKSCGSRLAVLWGSGDKGDTHKVIHSRVTKRGVIQAGQSAPRVPKEKDAEEGMRRAHGSE